MNTKKLILGLFMGLLFLGMSCTKYTSSDDSLYENGVDKTKLINGDKRSVDKTKLINGDKRS